MKTIQTALVSLVLGILIGLVIYQGDQIRKRERVIEVLENQARKNVRLIRVYEKHFDAQDKIMMEVE